MRSDKKRLAFTPTERRFFEQVARQLIDRDVPALEGTLEGLRLRAGKVDEFVDADEELQGAKQRIVLLGQALATADSVGEAEASTAPYARLGSIITVRTDEGQEKSYKLVLSYYEGDYRSGEVSFGSPVGDALMGAEPGDDVIVEAPAGRSILRVLRVGRETTG